VSRMFASDYFTEKAIHMYAKSTKNYEINELIFATLASFAN
jgi:hypothetical protein